MTVPTRGTVLLLDLRSADYAPVLLDMVNQDNAAELGVPSRVLIVDNVSDLDEHEPWYRKLAGLSQVTGVILIAVGSILDEERRPTLNRPAALSSVGVTMWVGDERGVGWTGGAQPGGVPEHRVALSDLIAALLLPLVFDRVLDEVRAVPHQTVNPGLDVDYANIAPGALRLLRIRALQQITSTGLSARQHDRASTALAELTEQALPAESPNGWPTTRRDSVLDQARAASVAAITRADRVVRGLRGVNGLFGKARIGALAALANAGEALRSYHEMSRRTLRDIERNLANGFPPANELVDHGLPAPATLDSRELATLLREAFRAELSLGRTLSGLADQARNLGNSLAGAPDVDLPADQQRGGSPELVAERLVAPSRLRVWPMPLGMLLPLIALTSLAATWLPGIGLAIGLVLVVGWAGLTLRLLTSSPTRVSDYRTPILASLGAALAGAVIGTLLPSWPALTGGAAVVAAITLPAVAVLATVIAWTRAVDAWRAELPLELAGTIHRRIVEQLDRAIATRWIPAERNRRLADSLLVVAAGLDAVNEAFRTVGDLLRATHTESALTSNVDAAAGLASVLHGDLVSITSEVLQPAFEDIATGAALSGDGRPFLDRARERISVYNEHLDNSGIRELPPGVSDERPRRALAASLWRASAASTRVLRSHARSELTQLCKISDLKLLNFTSVTVLHFASRDIIDLPTVDGHEVIRTGGNAVGVLRLVPVRAGIVHQSVAVESGLVLSGEAQVPVDFQEDT